MEFKASIIFLVLINSAISEHLSITPKVVNGTNADIAEFPFMVSLRKLDQPVCGATILNIWWILTAAHCLNSPVDNYSVQYATTVISRTGVRIVPVEAVFTHEGFLATNQNINDIGVAKVKVAFDNPLHDFKVRLPLAGSFFSTGLPSVLIGWGWSDSDGSSMTHLQKVDLQVVSSKDCALIHDKTVHYTNICAGSPPEGGRGQCTGDSGGPLLVNGIQVGIVSWSVKPCGIAPYPGVFTGVTHYIQWIEQTTGIDLQLDFFLRA